MSRRSKNYYFKNKFIFYKLELFFHKKTDLLLANSESVKKDLLMESSENFKIKVIYNGVKIQKINKFNIEENYYFRLKKYFDIPLDNINVILLANLIPVKSFGGYKCII